MIALGIETSCDETAVAIVDSEKRIHTNLVYSQLDEHRLFEGVVPEIAARAHLQKLPTLFDEALSETNLNLEDLDLIAATAGPGLIGGLHVGLQFAKGLSLATDKPLAAVNHLEGHALTPRLVQDIAFPYILLLVSGGHCQILICEAVGRYKRWGTTLDDAAGEAFDKVAKMLGLGYPGGPAVEKAALDGKSGRFHFKTPLTAKGNNKSCDFSFSGLKTAVRRQIELLGGLDALSDQDKADLALAFQDTVARALVSRCKNAFDAFQQTYETKIRLVVAGGVAANQFLNQALKDFCKGREAQFFTAPLSLCTDNAAMIAWAALERAHAFGLPSDLHVNARPRWPLDPHAAKSIFAGAAKA